MPVLDSSMIFTMIWWAVTGLVTFFLGKLTATVAKLRKDKEEKEESDKREIRAFAETCKYMLKKSLADDYEYYVEKQGWCSVSDKAEVEKAYNIYHGEPFNGNGQGSRYYSAIMNLPEHPEQKKED